MEIKPYTKQKFEKIIPWFEAINLDLLKAPISIVLLVTDRCFNKCQMCNHWKMDRFYDLDYETFRSIMLACQRNGTQSVFLSGGDCFAWKHWEQFLKDDEITIDVQITTPLVIPKNFDFELLKRIKWLRISYDGIRLKTFEQVRGVNKLSRVLNNLSIIISEKIIKDIGMTTTLQKANYPEIFEMGDYLVTLGIKRWVVVPVNYYEEFRIPHKELVSLGRRLMGRYGADIPINNFDVIASDWKEFNWSKNLPCIIPRIEAFIDTRLRVWPCCNIAQDSMGDEERVSELMMGKISHGGQAGKEFLELWNLRKNYLDEFPDFKKINKLCAYLCRFKYFYYNMGFQWCLDRRDSIYI